MLRSNRQFAKVPRVDWLLMLLAALLTFVYVAGAHRILSSWNPDLKDYTMWYDHIVQYGRWQSLNGSFASYNPPYIYVLSLASNLNGMLNTVTVLKLLNVPFMFASGLLAFSICRTLGCSKSRSVAAGWITAVAPEVVANALVWGQTDILETTFVLLFIRILLGKRPAMAMVALGIALSFKLQVIFLAPAILALLLTKELPLPSLLGVPAGYLVMMLPAELAGRSYKALYGVYSAQTGATDRISMGAANLFSIVSMGTGNGRVDAQHPFFVDLARIGVAFAAVLTISLVWYALRYRPLLQGTRLMLILAISALIEPFMLPKMHDRYFYIGDILVLLLGLVRLRMLFPAVLLQVAALLVYGRYLIGFHVNNLYVVLPAVLVAVAIVLLLREFHAESGSQEVIERRTEAFAGIGHMPS